MTVPSYKPQGYSTVSPYLIVAGAAEAIDFLVRAFDAVELRRFPAPGRQADARRGAAGRQRRDDRRWRRRLAAAMATFADALVQPQPRRCISLPSGRGEPTQLDGIEGPNQKVESLQRRPQRYMRRKRYCSPAACKMERSLGSSRWEPLEHRPGSAARIGLPASLFHPAEYAAIPPRLPPSPGCNRTTMSSLKPNQPVVAIAFFFPAAESAATISHPARRAASTARRYAVPADTGSTSGRISG